MIEAIIASSIIILGALATFGLRVEHRLTRLETLILNGGKRKQKTTH